MPLNAFGFEAHYSGRGVGFGPALKSGPSRNPDLPLGLDFSRIRTFRSGKCGPEVQISPNRISGAKCNPDQGPDFPNLGPRVRIRGSGLDLGLDYSDLGTDHSDLGPDRMHLPKMTRILPKMYQASGRKS